MDRLETSPAPIFWLKVEIPQPFSRSVLGTIRPLPPWRHYPNGAQYYAFWL
jgi:hypothetical protein